jgi:hypothetical protein
MALALQFTLIQLEPGLISDRRLQQLEPVVRI